MELKVRVIGFVVFIGVLLSPFIFYPHRTKPTLHHHNSRVPTILDYEYDLCGVLNGDESSCDQVLNQIGIDSGGPNWRLRELLLNYVNLHHKIMDPKDKTIPKRYIVIDDEPEAGLGNRFQMMVATFLYAILSKRALLIDWPEVKPFSHWNKEESVAMPHISQLLQDPSFSWDYTKYKHLEVFRCDNQKNFKYLDDTSFQCCNDIYGGFEGNVDKYDNFIKCFNTSRYRGVEEHFACDYYEEPEQQVMRILTWDYFVPSMVLNPHYKDVVQRTFGDDIFSPLARFLLRPTKKIQSVIDTFKRRNFGEYTLGLQIRKVGINKLNETQEDIFWNCAIQTTKDNADLRESVKWYLATDNYNTRQRAKEDFGDRIVTFDAPIQRNTTEGVVAGLIDMWLLSECDDIIASAASTYGKISYGLRGKAPKFVNRLSQCVQKADWQPCFFQFKQFYCFREESMTDMLRHQVTDCHFT